MQIGLQNFPAKQIRQALQALIREDADFVGQVLLQLEHLRSLDGLVTLVFFSALAGEDFYVDDRAFDARRAIKRSVANVSGLFAKDRAQQLLFRRKRCFTFRRNLADENVSWLYDGADSNHAAFVQVAKEGFADIWNIARHFLGAELGVARFDFILFDVNRSVVVVLHQLFADQNGVLKVVSTPWHERHQHVAAKSQFTAVGARTIGQNLLLLHAVAARDLERRGAVGEHLGRVHLAPLSSACRQQRR